MRAPVAWIALALLAVAASNVVWWQESRIQTYRSQLALQSSVLAERLGPAAESGAPSATFAAYTAIPAVAESTPVSSPPADAAPARLSPDERRLILDQYQDVIAQLNLPPATAARLEDLLVERIQAILAIEDAARREGYAEASAVVERAVAQTIAQEDQRIVSLIGLQDDLRLDGQQPETPELAGGSAPPATVVNVFASAPPPADYYAASEPVSTPVEPNSSVSWPYYGLYYPVAGYVAVGGSYSYRAPRRFEARTSRASFGRSASSGRRR